MRKFLLGCAILSLAGCGGGGTSGGGGFSSLVGPTSFAGLWQVTATINVIIGGAATNISHTSTLDVQPSGAITVQGTNADCALVTFANGARLTYQEECTFPAGEASCTIQFTTNAMFIGDNVSGTFGPESFVCVGSSTSYTGNLIGARVNPDDANNNSNDNGNLNDNGNDNNNDNDNDNNNDNGNSNGNSNTP